MSLTRLQFNLKAKLKHNKIEIFADFQLRLRINIEKLLFKHNDNNNNGLLCMICIMYIAYKILNTRENPNKNIS